MNDPLEGYASGFVAELAGQGYTPPSATLQLRLIAQLSDWLAAEISSPKITGQELHHSMGPVAYPQRMSAGLTIRGATVCGGSICNSEFMQR